MQALIPGECVFPPNEQEFFEKRKKRRVLVYYLGGVTNAEISALKFLGSLLNTQFIVATTQIINGLRAVNQFREKLNDLDHLFMLS